MSHDKMTRRSFEEMFINRSGAHACVKYVDLNTGVKAKLADRSEPKKLAYNYYEKWLIF